MATLRQDLVKLDEERDAQTALMRTRYSEFKVQNSIY